MILGLKIYILFGMLFSWAGLRDCQRRGINPCKGLTIVGASILTIILWFIWPLVFVGYFNGKRAR